MSSHFSTAFQRVRRSPYQTLAAISIMTMTLFLAFTFALIAAGSQVVLQYFETRPQVNAFFKEDFVPQPQDIDRIKSQLEATGKVDTFRYIDQEEALKIYQDVNRTDPLLIEAVTANMLPASVEVAAKDPHDLKQIAEILQGEPEIADVRFAEDVVTNLTRWTSSVRVIGISLVGAHLFITFIIILLIIGIKVSNRREEIYILQLVGATRSFVAAPFVCEGLLYGVFGAFIAWGITYLVLLYSTGFLVSFLAGLPILPVPVLFMLELLGAGILLGAIVGSIGGSIAVNRFLKR